MTKLVPLEELYKYEMWGRALAYGTSIKRLGELVNWLDGLLNALNVLNNFFYNTSKLVALHNPQKGEQLDMITYNVISPLSIFVAKMRSKIKRDMTSGVVDPRMTIDEYFAERGGMLYVMADDLLRKEICVQCKLLINQACCWTLGMYNSPHSLINDITAVFHRIIELYARFMGEFGEVRQLSDKSKYSSSVSNIALETLTLWDKVIHINNKLAIYEPEDYEALTGFAFDNMVELRVGSAAGHLTKIDLNANKVDYYDNDVPVVDVLGRMFSYIGGELASYKEDHAVYRFPPNKHKEVALILSLATSMDFRVGDAYRDIWTRMFLKTIDYEAYLITKNPMYLGEEYEGVRSIKGVRMLDYENFVESIMMGYFVELPFSAVIKQALAYAKRSPKAHDDLRAKVEQIWTSADKAYWVLRERGVIAEVVKLGVEKGMALVDYYLIRYLRENLPDLYQEIANAILEFIARIHWYYLKALVESEFIPSI